MINSLESERLERLIRDKVKRYDKLKSTDPDSPALLYLNSEITFLRDTILPIILAETTVDYSEIRNFVTRTIRKIESHPLAKRTTDIIIQVHLKEPDAGHMPLAAVAQSHDKSIDTELYVNFDKAQQYSLPL